MSNRVLLEIDFVSAKQKPVFIVMKKCFYSSFSSTCTCMYLSFLCMCLAEK